MTITIPITITTGEPITRPERTMDALPASVPPTASNQTAADWIAKDYRKKGSLQLLSIICNTEL
jgi:hypothetical protein